MRSLMTGNEAIARGAYEAGVRYASAYPGTPSTEILENISLYRDDLVAEWAPNEKVALEAAIGGAFAGARTFACMKHVGVNVAADPLFTNSYTGVNGGLVLVTADEPGMHSSQNEQDNRNYAKFAKIPLFEPSDSQEAKDMIKIAYEVSEKFDTPVLFRVTTRLSHSKSIVELSDRIDVPIKEYHKNVVKTVTVPAIAQKLRVAVDKREERLREYSNNTELNFSELNNSDIGIIASGMCYNFAREVFGDGASYMKLGFTNPLPIKKIKEFTKYVQKIYVIEENDSFIEEQLKANGIVCIGKDLFPKYGELTPDVLRRAYFGKENEVREYKKELIVQRPPIFCAGCPHRGFFHELGKKKDVVVSGDIGCYSLGFAKPYNGMDWIICMGASLSTGHGAQKVFNMVEGNKKKVVGVLGDSTFYHTGVNSLIDVAYNKGNSVSVILDNRITGMTGHQENPGTGFTLQLEETNEINIEELVKACGIKHIRVVNPNILKDVKETINWALDLDEASVIITRWPCALKKFSQEDKDEFKDLFNTKNKVDHDKCIGCKLCTKTGCPAIVFDFENKLSNIDINQCVGCNVCAQVCPKQAIGKEES